MKPLLIIAALSLTGCVASYQHLDPTPFHNDGMAWDLVCGGLEYDIQAFRLRGDVCHNIAKNGGQYLHTSIEYRFNQKR